MGLLPYLAGGIIGGLGYNKYKKEQSKDKKSMKAYEKQMKGLSKGKEIKIDAMSKEGKKLYKQMLKQSSKDYKKLTPLHKLQLPSQSPMAKQAGGVLQDLLSPSSKAYEQFKKPYMQEFSRDVLPGIATQSALQGLSGSGARDIEQTGAGQDLAMKLAQLKTGLMTSAIGPALDYAQMPFNEQMSLRNAATNQGNSLLQMHPYHTMYQQPITPGAPAQGQGMMQQLLPFAAQAGAAYAGSPAGASAISNFFSRNTKLG